MNTEKLVIVPTQQAQMMQVDVIEDKGGKTFIETANSVSSYKKVLVHVCCDSLLLPMIQPYLGHHILCTE